PGRGARRARRAPRTGRAPAPWRRHRAGAAPRRAPARARPASWREPERVERRRPAPLPGVVEAPREAHGFGGSTGATVLARQVLLPQRTRAVRQQPELARAAVALVEHAQLELLARAPREREQAFVVAADLGLVLDQQAQAVARVRGEKLSERGGDGRGSERRDRELGREQAELPARGAHQGADGARERV